MAGQKRDPSGQFSGRNLVGETYQWVMVDAFLFSSPTRGNTWACHCINCGKQLIWTTSQITRKKTSTCTCAKDPCTYTQDFTGQIVDTWKVLRYTRSGIMGRMWECECILCGNKREFNSSTLKRNKTCKCVNCKGAPQ